MKIIKLLFFVFNLALAMMLLLSYLSPQTDPTENYWVSLLGLIYPYLIVANVLFIIFWILVDYRWVFLSLICIALGWNHLQTLFTINTFESPDDNDLNIISYNIGAGAYYDAENNLIQSDKELLEQTLKSSPTPDILCIQETFAPKNAAFFADRFPDYKKAIDEDRRAMIYTRLPILDSGEIDFGGKVNSCTWADIQVGETTVRVYSAHMQTNSLTKYKNKAFNEADVREKKFWSRMKELFRRYKNSSIVRNEQARSILNHMKRSPHPVILCGDFNDTPMSHTYYLFNQFLSDAYAESGSGLGSTFRENIPLLRIDYIMHTKSLKNKRFSVGEGKFSDHYPIFATYSVE